MKRRTNAGGSSLWKRGLLMAIMLLCAGPFVTIPCFARTPHIHNVLYATCVAGDGGDGGIANNESTGGGGGEGGDCVFGGGSKGGGGGTILNSHGINKANGGDGGH